MSNEVYRKYFGYEQQAVQRAPVNLWGGFYKKKSPNVSTVPAIPALIPDETPDFEFNAFFRGCPAGHYVLRWRVQLSENFSVPSGLRFRVDVNYGAEEVTTGSLDVILPQERLEKLDGWHTFDLELEELVIVQPYQQYNTFKERQWTTVAVAMSNCESIGVNYSGLRVDYVELSSFTGEDPVSSDAHKCIVRRSTESKFTIDTAEYHVIPEGESKSIIPISRLTWSKEGTFLAALGLSDDTAYVTVWDMKHWNLSRPEDISTLHEKRTVEVKHTGGGLKDLSIGLAISADGSQVAVYQEPMVGQWDDESALSESTFHFRVLTFQPKQGVPPPQQDTLPLGRYLSQPLKDIAQSTYGDPQPTQNVTIVIDQPAEGVHSTKTAPLLGEIKSQTNWSYEEVVLLNPKLKHFIGYGAFLAEARSNDWRMNSSTTQLQRVNAGREGGGEFSRNTSSVFVACNGICIDVFTFNPHSGQKWKNTYSISLTDLTPTISRRVNCRMMMDVISRSTFMWLEDGGVCCSIWDLRKGSNVSYVSSPDNMLLGSVTFRGNSTMSISPDESMVVLASIDGVLTTFYANTGIAISSKKFKDEEIEYVSFNGQNNQLFVITRNTTTLRLKSRILDPLQLHSGMQANQVPVPIIGRTIHAFFRDEDCRSKGFVCEANGSKIHLYVTHEPVDKVATADGVNLASHTRTHYSSLQGSRKSGHENDHKESARAGTNKSSKDKRYEVRTATSMKPSRDDDDSMYWIIRVEVVERDQRVQNEKVIFSFVPEPWIRVSVSEDRKPKNLQKVYFLPGRKRFVVAGMQSLQIWSLPTNGSDDFKLVFIWSRPRVDADQKETDEKAAIDQDGPGEQETAGQERSDGKATADQERLDETTTADQEGPDSKNVETDLVGKYYHYIRIPRINLDQHTGQAEAHIKLKGGLGTDVVYIPGEHSDDFQTVFLNCARSIHLLAASYAYSIQESERFPKILDKSSLTSKKHAEAIARFTRGHINRLLPCTYFLPLPLNENGISAHTSAVQASPPTSQEQAPSQIVAAPTTSQPTPPRLALRLSTMMQYSATPLLVAVKYASLADQKFTGKYDSSPISIPEDLRKIAAYVDTQREKFWIQKYEDTGLDDIFTVLTLLLDQEDLKDANHLFIEGLFDTEGHEWTPHPSIALNPIGRLIDIRNEQLLNVLIDYCIKNAKQHHPGYLTPVMQYLGKISIMYPDIMGDLFRRASYIPAHNSRYVASHAIVANLRFSDWVHFLVRFYTFGIFNRRLFGFTKSSDINPYNNPVFSLQSQLPFYSHVGVGMVLDFVFDLVYFVLDLVHSGRKTLFPKNKNTEQTQTAAENRWGKIYVSPFQFKPMKGRDGRRERSFLAEVTGKDFFDSPAVAASLRFKWSNSGLYFWSIHFMAVLLFFILVLAITGQQIRVSTPSIDHKPTADEIADRYLSGWHSVFFLTIVVGCLLILYEFMQMMSSLRQYFRSPFNYVDLAACLFPLTGCFIFLRNTPGTLQEDTSFDSGPSQIWPMSFGILALYLKISGRYDPVESSMEQGSVTFRVIMVIFFFFAVIILLNVLIALVNGAFNESAVKYRHSFWTFIAEFLVEMEMVTMYNEGVSSSDSSSEYIYYCATDDEVKKFESSSTSEISSFAESLKAEHEITHKAQRIIMNSISTMQESSNVANEDLKMVLGQGNALKQDLVQLKEGEDPCHREMKNELKELRGLVESAPGHGELKQELIELKESAAENSRSHGELKQELVELRGLVERPSGHDELRQELAELRELVQHPPGHDELKEELSALKDLVKDLMRQLKSGDATT
ncbi:MAG: hypothetical protein J3Q66DRAFT_383963 [Benniella sp.]|nr:MAG: hypothetical protein J3Q66DRAFT_383963 [Benniella sp.]